MVEMDISDQKALSDVELLALSLSKPAAFEVLVERYQHAFQRKAVAILRDDEEASDAVQEAFVRIYAAAKRFKEQDDASFSSWAYKILVNQCFTAYRKRQRHAVVSLDIDPEFAEIMPDQSGVDEIDRKLTADYVMSLLSKLPVIMRRAMEMHFLQGLSEKEIAQREGVSHGTIRQRIYRAKSELRRFDQDQGLKLACVSVSVSTSQK